MKNTFNYRLMATEYKIGDNNHIYISIFEVFYDEHGIPNAYTKNPISLGVEDDFENPLTSLNWCLDKMKECLEKPILYYGDKFPQIYKIKNEYEYE